jgi:nicotinic acid phosphoribosyltransferase
MFRTMKKALAGMAALAALALGGAAIAGAAGSSTTTTSSSAPSSTQSGSGSAPARPAFNGPAHGTAAHENAETAVTGDAATKAQAAAVKSVGGGSAGAVTTDYTKSGYETTVTKSNGEQVEVHLDSSFNVMQGPGGHGGPPPSASAG